MPGDDEWDGIGDSGSEGAYTWDVVWDVVRSYSLLWVMRQLTRDCPGSRGSLGRYLRWRVCFCGRRTGRRSGGGRIIS